LRKDPGTEWEEEVIRIQIPRLRPTRFDWVGFFAVGLSLTACDNSLQEVGIAAQDYRFQPAAIRIRADQPVRLTIVNEGRETHEFSTPLFTYTAVRILERQGPDVSSGRGPIKIYPGRSATVTMNVPAGTFWYRCVIPGHRGMEGTLIAE
jgi:uncharacterized cupredoxin-like copper-binding protein